MRKVVFMAVGEACEAIYYGLFQILVEVVTSSTSCEVSIGVEGSVSTGPSEETKIQIKVSPEETKPRPMTSGPMLRRPCV